MDETTLAKFDPTVAELNEMVDKTRGLTVTDLEDPAQLEIVRSSRIVLKNARIKIEKTGKSLREDAVKFQRDVIAKEKELIGIIEPEEDRLSKIEDDAKKLSLMKERLEALPMKMQRISENGLDYFVDKDKEQVLQLDSNQFESWFNKLVARKNQFDAELVQKQKDDEEAARKHEQEMLDAIRAKEQADMDAKRAQDEENLRLHREADKKLIEEEKRMMQEAQDNKNAEIAERERMVKENEDRLKREQEVRDAEENARKETEERIAKEAMEKSEREEREKIEQQNKIERAEAYQSFLKDHGYADDGTFKIELVDDGVILYKILGKFKQ